MAPSLTHLNARGEAHMVDIAEKPVTRRRAVAQARILARPETVTMVMAGGLKKGDALATARIAGIMAAKKTADLIPLCHPLALTSVSVDIDQDGAEALLIHASVEITGQTGVEMEALIAASTAALTLYDMAKAIDRTMTITDLHLVEKSGGRSGDFSRS
jgi:cyclic pyranopterin phosphate synthase